MGAERQLAVGRAGTLSREREGRGGRPDAACLRAGAGAAAPMLLGGENAAKAGRLAPPKNGDSSTPSVDREEELRCRSLVGAIAVGNSHGGLVAASPPVCAHIW